VAAGSFLGFGPRFFGPFDCCSDHNGSFDAGVENMGVCMLGARVDAGVDTAVLLSEAGNGQSLPPYDLDRECPQFGVTRGVLLSWSDMLCDRK